MSENQTFIGMHIPLRFDCVLLLEAADKASLSEEHNKYETPKYLKNLTYPGRKF